MRKVAIILFIFITLFSSLGCNKLFFSNTMPLESEIATDFPTVFLGDFLEIYFDENSVQGKIKTISKISSKRYLIETLDVVYLDSTYCAEHKMLPIKKVDVASNHIEITTENEVLEKLFTDTISNPININNNKRKQYKIDLNSGHFFDDFSIATEDWESKDSCKLLVKNGSYYLNIGYYEKYWLTIKLASNGKDILLNKTFFSLHDEDKLKFKKLKSKYGFQEIKLPDNRKTNWHYYLAKSDNDQFNDILNEDFFDETTWHKIEVKKTNWIIIISCIIGSVMLLLFVFMIKRKVN